MPACARSRLAVDLDGLAELRRALADESVLAASMQAHRIAWRVMPAQRSGSTGGTGSSAAVVEPFPKQAPRPDETPRIPVPAQSTEPSDEREAMVALVTRAQAGDGEAFGEIYDRYSQVVYRFIAYRCGNPTLAEDLTSETFLRALRRISSYTWQGRDFGAWLVTIARNLLADHFKSGRYRLEVATSDLVEAGADRVHEGPEDEVLSALTNVRLIDAIKQLGGEQQECIVLRFLQGFSVAETAAALGKNEGAVKALQYRAVKALGRLLPAELIA